MYLWAAQARVCATLQVLHLEGYLGGKEGIVNRIAIAAAIALAISASPAFAWDDKECEDWLKTHPTPHPDCVQSTPTPPTATPKPQSTPTPVVPTPTQVPNATATPETNLPATPVATPNRPQIQPTPQTECIPCAEADAPTPMPPLGPAGPNSPAVLAAVVEIAPTVEPQAVIPVQVLAAGPALLPAAGTPIPYVASLLLGLGLTIGGWLMRRGS